MENIYWLQNNEEIWTRQTALMKISILTVLSKTKGHPKGCPFVLGSAARRAAPPFGISMLGVGKAAPAQFPACGREFTRHSARGPEGPLGGSLATVLSIQNIDFNRPFQNERHDESRAFRFGFRRPEGGSTLR